MDSLIHLSMRRDAGCYSYTAVPLAACGLAKDTRPFLSRWLDVTKSTLLFARGVILVEGIAEAMLMPELARRVLNEYNQKHGESGHKLPDSLEDAGVTVVNMNGIYFKHFMQLFCDLPGTSGQSIPVRCSA